MAFQKYRSIENHYSGKTVSWWLNKFPSLRTERFVLQEKLHGANFSVEFTSEGDVHLGRRSSRVNPGDKFYNVHNAWANVADRFEGVRLEAMARECSVTFHGELYGGNVQKGVDYGPEQKLAFFDLRVESLYQTQKVFAEVMEAFGLTDLATPVVAHVVGLQAALDHSCDFDSLVLGKSNNPAEGFVLKAWDHMYSWEDAPFYLKKKSAAFLENKAKKKVPQLDRKVSTEAALLKAEFSRYVSPQRLDNLFSKLGRMEEMKQVGRYMKAFMADAAEDFRKDFYKRLATLSDKEQKYVLNASKDVVALLKNSLKENV